MVLAEKAEVRLEMNTETGFGLQLQGACGLHTWLQKVITASLSHYFKSSKRCVVVIDITLTTATTFEWLTEGYSEA